MACWLDYLRWFHAGLRRRKRGRSTRDMGGGRIFGDPNDVEVNVVSPGVFVFFFPCHILVCFILVWCIRCLKLGGQPVGDA